MKKNLPVIKTRFMALILSIVLLVVGVGSLIFNGGFNTGIDFDSGLSQRIQVAPVGLSLTYSGNQTVSVSVDGGGLVIEERGESGVKITTLTNTQYPTVNDLAPALQAIDGVSAQVIKPNFKTENLLSGYGFPAVLSANATHLNFATTGDVTIDEVRESLSQLDSVQVQTVGNEENQVFQIKLGTNDGDTQDSMEKVVSNSFKQSFDNGFVILESNFVGPRFSKSLILGSLLAVLVAMVLILFYIWVRFRIAYALSSLIALTHDVLLLLGFIALFQFEVSSTTIAAVLTIIGYSLNATIVIFDRIRENIGLMKDTAFKDIIEHSVTQSLTRTVISSLTTVLAVLPLAIFASGTIKLFAINLIFGIVIGTYSSNFIAPSFLYWISKGKLVKEKNKK